MALGSKALLALCLTAIAYAAEYPAQHDHLFRSCSGTLKVDDSGVAFTSRKHSFAWKYQDIQQLDISAQHLRVRTYKDDLWKAGIDQTHEFRGSFEAAEPLLKGRIVNRIPAAAVEDTWTIPAKLTARIKGSEGDLLIGHKRIVYRTKSPEKSRTWEFDDIENVSTSNRYELTITTLDRDYRFQLKQPLGQARYDELWLKLQQYKGLGLIGESK